MPAVWQHLDVMARCPGGCSSALPAWANTTSSVCRLSCHPAGLMLLKKPDLSSKTSQRSFPAQPFERKGVPGKLPRSYEHAPGGKVPAAPGGTQARGGCSPPLSGAIPARAAAMPLRGTVWGPRGDGMGPARAWWRQMEPPGLGPAHDLGLMVPLGAREGGPVAPSPADNGRPDDCRAR